MSTFYAVSDELTRLKQQLSLSRVNVDDVQRQLSIVTADMDTLQEETDTVIEAAAVTERLVRKALQFRNDPNVVAATQQAKTYYETDFDFERSMTTLGVVLNNIEANTLQNTIAQYRQEKETLAAEFAGREA
jgi:septation ring formation regulator